MSTLEMLMALALLVVSITTAVTVTFSNQSISVDAETNNQALYMVKRSAEDARATARQDFSSVVSQSPSTNDIYTEETAVVDLTAYKKRVTSRVLWRTAPQRPQLIELTTTLTDASEVIALGGDDGGDLPGSTSTWDNPQTFASSNFNPGKPRGIDVLNRIAYMGGDKAPYLFIADARNAVLGQSSGLFVTFANGFDAGATINDIDVAMWQDPLSGTMKYYAYAAMDTAIGQLKVIDVTDIHNPMLVATRTLSPCVGNSEPEGWRVFYYRNRLYLTTRETAGPEFHVFDVTTPMAPAELGSGGCLGTNLNTTVNSLVVRDQSIGGVTKRFAYLATTNDNPELRVLDVTDPLAISGAGIAAANRNLSGNQDGESVYVVGKKLYFGRQSAPSGPDLYVFEISNPEVGLSQLGVPADIGTSVISIIVAGRFAFLGTQKVSEEFQVWDISDVTAIAKVKSWNFSNIIENGFDYEDGYIYASAQGNDALRIIYSP